MFIRNKRYPKNRKSLMGQVYSLTPVRPIANVIHNSGIVQNDL